MRRGLRIALIALFILVVLLIALAGFPWIAEGVLALVFGWVTHIGRALPRVSVNWSGMGLMAVCVALAALFAHRFCWWLWRGTGHTQPWRRTWTFAGLATVVLMFAAGMAFTGVAHQTGWLIRSPQALTRSTGGASNERNASASLRNVALAQQDFYTNDRDGNGKQDYWRDDIAGLYTLTPPNGAPIKLIEVSVAGADDRPAGDVQRFTTPSPKAGYRYRALKFKGESVPDRTRFAACAYPDTRSAGRAVFIVSHINTVYWKDFPATPPPDFYPDDPGREGWRALD